ncbi:class I adenylate-forming enzyme family protein [Stella sp.]|uniref:class I adenylate-forming enzyme family protein n=1 Tax=Stella sp. TaxID=2912054 RepID=UPI0035B15DFD
MLLSKVFAWRAREQPDAPAVIDGASAIGYGALDGAVRHAVAWLGGEDVRAGDTVALTLADPLAHLVLSLALMRIGAVQTSLAPGLPLLMRTDIARTVGVGLTVTDGTASLGEAAAARVPDVRAWVRAGDGAADPPPPPDPEATAVLAVGSGSTGAPKVIPVRHRHLTARSLNDLAGWPTRAGDRVLVLQSLGTLTHLSRSLFTLHAGATLVLARDTAPDERAQAIAGLVDRHDVRHLHCTPLGAGLLTRAFAGADRPRFPGLANIRIGAAVVGARLRSDVRRLLSPNLTINYGANEVGSIACGSAAVLARHPDSVGRALPWNEVEIVDADGRPLPAGATGLVRVRGPSVVDGYVGDPEATARRFRGGWFHPGDVGTCTEDGVLHLAGRDDDMMIVAGINVFPAEIERVLEAHPAVGEVAVLPAASETLQDLPVAFVVARAPTSEAALLAHARERLGVRGPRRVHLVDHLPRNPAGKIDRRALGAMVRPGAGAPDLDGPPA